MNLVENVKAVVAFKPESRNSSGILINDAAASAAATGIDTQGFDQAMIVVKTGSIGATNLDIDILSNNINDADDSGTVAVADVRDASNLAAFAQITNADDDKIFVINVRVKDTGRYLFVRANQSAGVAAEYDVTVLLGTAKDLPVAQAEAVAYNA